MIHSITSLQNKNLKLLAKLREKRTRQKTGLFLVEGTREIQRAVASGYELQEFYFCSEYISDWEKIIENISCKIFEISSECFDELAVREESDGILAVFIQKKFKLEEVSLNQNTLIIAIENLEKPGNLGAILRSADGAGASAVVLLENSVDQYNPNSIRASLGTVFSIPVIHSSNMEFCRYLKDNKITSYAALISQDSKSYFDTKFEKSSAIILGNEAKGLSSFWQEHSNIKVIIPMRGIADSLNVSVSASILAYECLRQQNFKE